MTDGGLWPDSAIFLIAGVVGVYALAALMAVWVGRSDAARRALAEDPDPALIRYLALAASYFEGARAYLVAMAAAFYGVSVVCLLLRDDAAVWLFAAAVTLDVGLFLLWRERAGFVARLTPIERASEIVTAMVLGACLYTLSYMHFSGVLA